MTDQPAVREKLIERLTVYVKADAHSLGAGDSEYIADCLDEAVALVDNRCGATEIPAVVLHRAYIEVGSELYNRRSAPNGISQFAAGDGSPIRVARDPMVAGEKILAPYLPLGIG